MKPARRPRSSPGGARALLLLTALLALPRCTRPAQAQGDTARTALPQGFARGISYAHDWSQHGVRGYGTESDRAELARVRAMGATWVSVMPFGYLSGPASTALRTSYDRPGAERDEALRATIRRAHALGLRVLLKPHLWVSGSWPGAVDPPRDDDAAALVDAWVDVFNLAGAQLERLAPAQACHYLGLLPLLAEAEDDDLIAVLDPRDGCCRLLVLRAGLPVFERVLPIDVEPLRLELERCLAFLQRRDPQARRLRLLLTAPFNLPPGLEGDLGITPEVISSEPYGSLVLKGLAVQESRR